MKKCFENCKYAAYGPQVWGGDTCLAAACVECGKRILDTGLCRICERFREKEDSDKLESVDFIDRMLLKHKCLEENSN